MVMLHRDRTISQKDIVEIKRETKKRKRKRSSYAKDAIRSSSFVDTLHDKFYDSEEPGAYASKKGK